MTDTPTKCQFSTLRTKQCKRNAQKQHSIFDASFSVQVCGLKRHKNFACEQYIIHRQLQNTSRFNLDALTLQLD